MITSCDAALREVSQSAAIHVEASGLAEAMEGLLLNEEERLRRRGLSLKRAFVFLDIYRPADA